MKVTENGRFGVYVYANEHPPPHCHLRYGNGDDISVLLPTMVPMYGAVIDKKDKEFLVKNIKIITDAWEKYNS